ncbi:MAG: O-methyltransferase [Duncaniella sp.]|nr:O-methyltransferase [Duncaniella sp.]
MNGLIEDYIAAHTSPEPEHLARLYRHTHLTRLYPRMCSGHLQGRLLTMLASMVNPRRVLELGTFSGYSALCLAEGLSRPDARVDTIEIDDEAEDSLRELFATAPFGDRIDLHIGDALDVIPRLPYVWDLVYIDANKRHYAEYLDLILPRLSEGGFIIADNTLWDGKVVDTVENHDPQTLGLDRFNSLVASRKDLLTVIVPVRDGLTLIRKLSTRKQ